MVRPLRMCSRYSTGLGNITGRGNNIGSIRGHYRSRSIARSRSRHGGGNNIGKIRWNCRGRFGGEKWNGGN